MKTRKDLYGQEAAGILRDLSMYHTLSETQLCRLYSKKSQVIQNLLQHLVRQGRIVRGENGLYHADSSCAESIDRGMMAAVWVMLDFIETVEYHSVSDFPTKLIFFSDGEVYEVIYIPFEQEALFNHLLNSPREDPSSYIIILDNPEQIHSLHLPNVSGYCTVSQDGSVQYYNLE